jgi:serine/threonine protein phosphatase 1
MTLPIDVSPWKPAPFALGGETVFAVGDVHGCVEELQALLGTVADLARESAGKRRLVWLGDMVDRGPDTLGVLRLWGEDAETRGVDRVDHVIGNHEILMLLAIGDEQRDGQGDGPMVKKARTMWLADRTGGNKVLEEMRCAAHDPLAPPSYALAVEALGEGLMRQLLTQRSHVRVGNALFVHGGLRGGVDEASFLATPWTAGDQARWAWITKGFLDWQGGFGGTLVVHGHTPPHKHFPYTQMEDPHLFLHDRLGLDGGSALTGFVVGAEVQDGRYRILKAGRARDVKN